MKIRTLLITFAINICFVGFVVAQEEAATAVYPSEEEQVHEVTQRYLKFWSYTKDEGLK